MWQPIATAPKDGTWVLAFWEGRPVSWDNYGWVRWVDGHLVNEAGDTFPRMPTHWQPLPEPPEVERG